MLYEFALPFGVESGDGGFVIGGHLEYVVLRIRWELRLTGISVGDE